MDRRSNEDKTDKLQQLDSERKEKKPPSLHKSISNSTSTTKKQTVTSGIPVAQRKQTYDRGSLSYEEDGGDVCRASASASQESISALEPYYPEGGDTVNEEASKIEKFIVCRRLPETRHKSTNVDYISDLLKHDFIKIHHGASPRPDVSSARTFVLHELRSRVYRLEDELKDCRKGKQLAERMLQRHVVALEKYEGVNSNLPRLAASRTAEILSLHTGLRKVHKQLRHTQDHLRHRERRIMKLEKENKSLTELVERGDLVNKHKLATELEQTQAELGVATAKLDHLQSTFEKSQRHLQTRIDRETKKLIVERGKLSAAQERIQALLTKLQEKEKCIASLSLRHKRFIGLGDQKRSGEGTPRTENTPRAAPTPTETPRDKSGANDNTSPILQQKIAKIGTIRNVGDYQSPTLATAEVKNINEVRCLRKPECESAEARQYSAHNLLIGRISSPRIMRPQKEAESSAFKELRHDKHDYFKQHLQDLQPPQRVQTVGAQPSHMQGSGDFEELPVQPSAFSMSADNVFDVSQRKKSLHLLSLESPREAKPSEYQNHFDSEHARVSISSSGRNNQGYKTQTPRTEVLQKLEQSQQQKGSDASFNHYSSGQAISRAVWSGYSQHRQFPRSPVAYEYNKRLTRVANATNTQLPIVRSPQNFQSGLPQTRFILQGSLENPFHSERF